jgi:AmmeMemoRadiSam system protein B
MHMSTPQPVQDIRPSPIAGRWYPGDPEQLAVTIDEFVSRAQVAPIQGRLIGLLTPHAGHRYSGPVAGHAFRALQESGREPDTVVLVGPSHYPYPAPAITSGHDAYETPLGTVPVNRAMLDALCQRMQIEQVRRDAEHSLEIELPFLQRTLGEFRLVPLALIDQSLEMAEQLGHALADILAGENAVLVASSDLSHFYPQPVANRLDQVILDAVAAYDPEGIIQAEEQGTGFACGRAAIAAVMIAARELGADTARVLNYATSGDITHDYQQVVGYGAAVFYQSTVLPAAN